MIKSIYSNEKTIKRLTDLKYKLRLSSIDKTINHLLDGEKRK